ncbi:hypothetical protein V2J09_013023 [Rumex salicifolius]
MKMNYPSAVQVVASLSILFAAFTLPSLLFRPPSLPSAIDVLHRADVIGLTAAFGPESLAFDPHGHGPYTGVSDGRILKWDPHSLSWLDFAFTSPHRKENVCVHPVEPELEHMCGRPLGLRFENKTGDLYIADAYFGLLVVSSSGGLATQLASEAEGVPFRFTNDLDIDEQRDVIYFTDTSAKFYRRQYILAAYAGDKSGRLMKYNMRTREVTVLARELEHPNGVALNKDRSFLLVAETTTGRIMRYWIRGPMAGSLDTFAMLPGFPDNIRRNLNGEFWVGLAAKRTRFAGWFLSRPWLGRVILKLHLSNKQLAALLLGNSPHSTIVRLSEEGEIVEILEDSGGKTLEGVSEVEERDGRLWVGSVMVPFIGVYNLQ